MYQQPSYQLELKFSVLHSVLCYLIFFPVGPYADQHSPSKCAMLKKEGKCRDKTVAKQCERTCSGCPSRSTTNQTPFFYVLKVMKTNVLIFFALLSKWNSCSNHLSFLFYFILFYFIIICVCACCVCIYATLFHRLVNITPVVLIYLSMSSQTCRWHIVHKML